VLNTPFTPWPNFSEEEANAAKQVILSNRVNYWTGTECREFEKEFAAWCGVNYAIALANGTVALDLALRALGIGAGDEVIVPSRTFIATASCVVNAGAIPIFADVDLDSQNITADSVRAVLTPRTRAIICVHLAGWPCDMDPIMQLANEQELKVIEDCAQAHGAQYKGKSVGSIGHIGAWSFCQDKIMTTGGEGGMVTTNDETLWRFMWAFKDHGKSWEAIYEREHPPGFRWVHDSFGTNWRMMEVQAAIGRVQLRKVKQWQVKRYVNAQHIWRVAEQFPALRVPPIPQSIQHAVYKCYIFIEPELLKPGWTRNRIIEDMNIQGVPCYAGSCSEIYLENAFNDTPWRPTKRLPNAMRLGDTSLMFLVHPGLKAMEIEKTCSILRKTINIASVCTNAN